MFSRQGLKRLTAVIIAVVVPLTLYTQRQNIYDWVRLRTYNPPAEIAALANDTRMNSTARHDFYVNHPQLMSDSTTFRQNCKIAEQTIVLGCYLSDQRGIYVYNVQDQRLQGVQQVTAAHEMLHAAYDRLSSADRKTVDQLLQTYYDQELTDQRVKETVDAYRKTEPKDVLSEMHSIFGTEIAKLPAELETYYGRYFSDRQAVVAYSQKYEAEFTSRNAKIDQYEVQLKTLKDKISSEEASLKSQLTVIQAQQSRLDTARSSNPAAYNAEVDSYNAKVDAYNAGISQYRRDVARYNSMLTEYNQLAGELKQLFDAIDTRLDTQTTR